MTSRTPYSLFYAELLKGLHHTTVLHKTHRIGSVLEISNDLKGRRKTAILCASHRQGAVTQLMGQCRGRTHVPMPLDSNPGGAALHRDRTKRANKPTFSGWPTSRALDKSNVTVPRVLGLMAGQSLPKTYRSGVTGFAIPELKVA